MSAIAHKDRLARACSRSSAHTQHLRVADAPLEDRKTLLGHKRADVTTHYSAPEVAKTIEYVELVCVERANSVLRLASPAKCEALSSALASV